MFGGVANGRGNGQSIVQSKANESLESAAESGRFAVVLEGEGRKRIMVARCQSHAFPGPFALFVRHSHEPASGLSPER